jgi:hypothetical protein
MIPLVGALLIAGALFAASHIDDGQRADAGRLRDAHARQLDAMQQDVRAVTPAGVREISVRGYACGEVDDSSGPSVVRELRIDARQKHGVAQAAVLDGYIERGWRRQTFGLAVSTSDVVQEDRVISATESEDGRTLTIVLNGRC